MLHNAESPKHTCTQTYMRTHTMRCRLTLQRKESKTKFKIELNGWSILHKMSRVDFKIIVLNDVKLYFNEKCSGIQFC